MVTVRCEKCGAEYETELPAAGVERVRRCAVCHRSGLKIVHDDEAADTAGKAAPAPSDG